MTSQTAQLRNKYLKRPFSLNSLRLHLNSTVLLILSSSQIFREHDMSSERTLLWRIARRISARRCFSSSIASRLSSTPLGSGARTGFASACSGAKCGRTIEKRAAVGGARLASIDAGASVFGASATAASAGASFGASTGAGGGVGSRTRTNSVWEYE